MSFGVSQQNHPLTKMNEQITDAQALEALTKRQAGRAQTCDTFATKTVFYPVWIERKKGSPEMEIRQYVTMGRFYPKSKMEKAADVEKRYAKLNKACTEELKRLGRPIYRKDPGNILNASPIDLKK